MSKGKNSNYRYKQQREIQEKEKQELTFREKAKRKNRWINIFCIFAAIISIVMLILFQNGTFKYGNIVLLFVLAPAMWLQGIRYNTTNKKLAKVCRVMAIIDAMFFFYTIYYAFFYQAE